MRYDHRKIEKKWQREWAKKGLYKTPDTAKVGKKENYYLLVEFPYPSGNLHVGHWYAFAVPDMLARMLRMQGKNVLYPIGFDAFGLPAENAAIQRKLNPRTWTYDNIAYMRRQIASMGASFDVSREVITCDPAYYKWTQWQFLQLHKRGLVYRRNTAVNWCPKDKTVLANEQVADGKCERCGSEVVQKEMLQWNIKITEYADRLIDDLGPLDWPEQIKESQRNWIGRSEGAELDFRLTGGVRDDSRFLILHGREAKPSSVFIPWLKQELEKAGHEVEVPQLPNTDEPNAFEQAEYVLKHCTVDERTVVIGHSSGGIAAMRLLEKGAKVRRVVLVSSPFSGTFLDGKQRPSVSKSLKSGFDFGKIRQNTESSIVLADVNDDRVPFSDAESYAANLKGLLIQGRSNKTHFMDKREPDVLMAALPTIRVFTTRADTLFGATYLVLAPEHRWLALALQHSGLLKNADEIGLYIALSKKKTELERQENRDKTGVELKGVRAVNPATKEEIPIFVADYVLGHYGTGAVMGVPAHDERDFEFAKKYGLEVKGVVEPVAVQRQGRDAVREDVPYTDRKSVFAFVQHWSEDKYLAVKYKPTDMNECVSGGIEAGEDAVAAAVREIREETGYTKPKLVRTVDGTIHSRYYSPKLRTNRRAEFTTLLFKLEDGSRDEVAPHEKADHDVSWLSQEAFDRFLNRDDVKHAWSRLQDGTVCYTGEGILTACGEFTGLQSGEAKGRIADAFGRRTKQYRLRDWIISRQRYWGVPIPIIHCRACALRDPSGQGAVPVPEKDLPVKLPDVKDYLPDGHGKSPLAKVKKFVNVKCPQCGGHAERETDTLDTFVDSSWYFLRYTDPKNTKEFASLKKQDHWMPVDFYSGGPEHTTMHVLYSRFWHKALYDLGLVRDAEPYRRRMSHGLILGPDNRKMSKSHGNVIDPDDVVERLGADTLRLYLAFIGPYNEVGSYPWNLGGVVGVRRFLERVWKLSERVGREQPELENLLHRTVKKVGDDIAALKLNTAISQLMIFLNAAEKQEGIGKEQWRRLLQLLAPFAPHMAEELWSAAKCRGSVHTSGWPVYDSARLEDESVTIAVQINGKTRADAKVMRAADKATFEAAAREAVAARLAGSKIIRTIVVPGRLVNFVVAD